MNDPQERLMELFHEGCDRPAGAEREAFLAAACGTDVTLLEQVTRLIEAHAQAGDFLQEPVALPPAGAGDDNIGAVIGRYHLLEEIGEGGFGRVFRAEQTEPVHRCVALKVIKAGMDTREVIARFEAERQALALMDHPHIAKVLDAGTTDAGRPYFVMELVDGLPITRFCDQHRLATVDRLALFIKVCHAVQHAHQKGVIHRDLKPTNILVAEVDGQPEPKIIDFGVAKALGPKLTERTLFTAAQQVIGTPGYMSPEQADPQDGDIDTRCDIYSLGVLLYELLTGVTPFDTVQLHRAAVDEIRRIIRETDPPKPSTRLRELGVELGVVARHRRTEPAALTRSVHGDLDWIVMKSLEKDRARRYQTISALAEDLHHHLAHEPVTAGPPGRLYRLGKFIRRHRFGSAMAAAAAVAVLASLAALTVGLRQAEQERDRAVAAEQRAEDEAKRAEVEAGKAAAEAAVSTAVNAFLLEDLLGQASPEEQPDREVKLRTLVDRAADKVGERFRDQPWLELETRLTLSSVYRDLGEFKEAWLHLNRAKEICEQQELPVADTRRLRVRMAEAMLHTAQRRYPESQSILEEIIPALREAYGEAHPETVRAWNQLVLVCRRQGLADQARALLANILPVARRVLGPDDPETLRLLHNSAAVSSADEARQIYERVIEAQTRVLGPDSADTLRSRNNLNAILQGQPMLAKAEEMQRKVLDSMKRVLGENHAETLWPRNTLADILKERGKLAEASCVYREAVAVSDKALGSEHPETLALTLRLASAYIDLGDLGQAGYLAEQAIAKCRSGLGERHSLTLSAVHLLGVVQARRGLLYESRELFRQVAVARGAALGQAHPDTLLSLRNLALTCQQLGLPHQAAEHYRETAKRLVEVGNPAHPTAVEAISELGRILDELGKPAQAREACEAYWTMLRERLEELRTAPDNGQPPDLRPTLHALAASLQQRGKLSEACQYYAEIIELQRSTLGEQDAATLKTMETLMKCLRKAGRGVEAGKLADTIAELHRQHDSRGSIWDSHEYSLAAQAAGKKEEARLHEEQSLELMLKIRGPNHKDPKWNFFVLVRLDIWQGEWREILKHSQIMIDAAPANYTDAHRCAAVTALALGDRKAYEAVRDSMLARFRATRDPVIAAQVAQTCLLASWSREILADCSRLAEMAGKAKPNDPDIRLSRGIHLQRAGDLRQAADLLEPLTSKAGACRSATACFFLALGRQQSGDRAGARAILARGSAVLNGELARAVISSPLENWCATQYAVIARAEAERSIFGRETSPPFDPAMAQKFSGLMWAHEAALPRGRDHVLAGEWAKASEVFGGMLSREGFSWQCADAALSGVLKWMAVAFLRAGDDDKFRLLCQTMASQLDGWPVRSGYANSLANACIMHRQPEPGLLELASRIIMRGNPLQENPEGEANVAFVRGLLEYRMQHHEAALAAAVAATSNPNPLRRAAAEALCALAAHQLHQDDESARHARHALTMLPLLNEWRHRPDKRGEVCLLLQCELLLEEADWPDPALVQAARDSRWPESLALAMEYAAGRDWRESAAAYRAARADPAFCWDGSLLLGQPMWRWLGIALVGAEDFDGHLEFCRNLALEATKPGEHEATRFAAICLLPERPAAELLTIADGLLARHGRGTAGEPDCAWKAWVQGLLDYRRGAYEETVASCRNAVEWTPLWESYHIYIRATASVLGGMAATRLGRTGEGRNLCRRAARILPEARKRATWHMDSNRINMQFLEVLLGEADRLDPELAAAAKSPDWPALLQAGKAAALAGEWQAAAAAFDKALAEPGFSWEPANAELPDFCNWMGVAFARGGDQAGQASLSRRLAAMISEAPNPGTMPLRLAKVCVLPANCPPAMLELAHRLLIQFNADPAARISPDWTGLHWALLEYRRGNHSQACDSARAAEDNSNLAGRATATLLHAMAAKRLGHDEESTMVFQRAAAFVPQLKETSEADPQLANVQVFQLLFDEAKAMFGSAPPEAAAP